MDRALEDRVRKQNWVERHSLAFPLLVFALSIALVISSAYVAEVAERDAMKQLLATQAVEFKQSILREEAAYGATLQIGALFLSHVAVTPDEFQQFVQAASLSIDPDGARGLGWAPLTRDDDGERINSVPIEYLSPMDQPNQNAIGFDMYSEKARRDAIDIAAATGIPTATAPVVLTQDVAAGRKPGFLIYKPVPSNEGLPKGMVYAAFQGERFLRAQLRTMLNPPDYAALYDQGKNGVALLAEFGDRRRNLLTRSAEMKFGNRQWVLVIGREPPALLSAKTLLLILFGLTVSALLLFISRMAVRAAMRDKAAYEWQSRQLQIRNTLNRELNHRVKNTLANVLSILALTRRRSTSLDEFADGLAGRIHALSATHNLLTQSEWSNANIREVFEAELAPYLHGSGPIITLSGPDIDLAPNTALTLGLAVHELATNASKYGALSTAEGLVHISWSMVDPDNVAVIWSEAGGPKVSTPTMRGFGLELLENIVSEELSNSVRIEFKEQGLRCQLTVPVRPLPSFQSLSQQ
jgi:two-component sensor histidine kinase/CHASE1-domain containing sensor protein